AIVADGEDREREDLEADDDRDGAVDPLDPRLGIAQRRDDLAVAEGPVGTAEARVRGAHDDADRDQPESGREGQRGELLEAVHGRPILAPRPARTVAGARSDGLRYAWRDDPPAPVTVRARPAPGPRDDPHRVLVVGRRLTLVGGVPAPVAGRRVRC